MFDTPKSAYFNIKWKSPKNPTLNVDYVVINELTKFRWTKGQLNNSLAYLLEKKTKSWLRGGLLKIKSKFCHLKVHSYLLLQIFVILKIIHVCFSNMYNLLSPYTTSEDEIILKNAFEFSYIFETTIHGFISKVHYCMFVICWLEFIIIYIFLFKLAILIHIFFATLMIWPYVYGIWI